MTKTKTNPSAAAARPTLIESDEFPFEFLSSLAQRESWRKEIYRPVYHIHKWWAKRLGSVFRGIILGSLLPADANLKTAFYEAHDFSGVSVFDPFMGSGTTVGEAHKLGCTPLGRDINPVACEPVRVAMGPLNGNALRDAFEMLSATVGERIRRLYRAAENKESVRDVLYYFWVKQEYPVLVVDSQSISFPRGLWPETPIPSGNPKSKSVVPNATTSFPRIETTKAFVARRAASHLTRAKALRREPAPRAQTVRMLSLLGRR